MRVLFFVLLLCVAAPLAHAADIFSFDSSAASSAEADIYVCPMHPHIHGDKGDTCPICGMNLVPQTPPATTKNPEHHESAVPDRAFYIEPTFIQALGVKTDTVSRHTFGRHIRAFGEIVPNTRHETEISLRTEGWIVDLITDAVGDTVKKGDLLFTYYSPDLMMAQSDYLRGRDIGNPEQRLRQYGMDEKALSDLKTKGKMLEETPFYAAMDGTIVDLNVRKGSFVEEGQLALTLQDFSQVWVEADVPVRDLSFLSEGQNARVLVPETGKVYQSSIDFIHHVADPRTRTGIVRLILPHENLEPKPGSFVDVIFEADNKKRLAVPAEAVLYGGQGAIVMESLGEGRFRAIPVETGMTADGFTEILSGLGEGQAIVTSGQFLLDAESNLRSGMTYMSSEMPDLKKGRDHVH